MLEPEVFVLADLALNRVVAQIRPDQWSKRMPSTFVTLATDDGPPTLREVIGYHAYDDAWVPDMLAGRTMEEVGPETFAADPLGDDPIPAFDAFVRRAVDAAPTADLERTVHTSFGDFPTRDFFWQINSFRGLRAWELGRILGLDDHLDPALVQGLWEEIEPHAEEWRAIGVFGPAVEVAADAPLLDRLVAITGRDPRLEPAL